MARLTRKRFISIPYLQVYSQKWASFILQQFLERSLRKRYLIRGYSNPNQLVHSTERLCLELQAKGEVLDCHYFARVDSLVRNSRLGINPNNQTKLNKEIEQLYQNARELNQSWRKSSLLHTVDFPKSKRRIDNTRSGFAEPFALNISLEDLAQDLYPNNSQIKSLIADAKNDLQIAHFVREKSVDWALFIFDQAIEKLLRAQIHSYGFKIPSGHQLQRLCLSLKWTKINGAPLAGLPYVYADSRYPSKYRETEYLQHRATIWKAYQKFLTSNQEQLLNPSEFNTKQKKFPTLIERAYFYLISTNLQNEIDTIIILPQDHLPREVVEKTIKQSNQHFLDCKFVYFNYQHLLRIPYVSSMSPQQKDIYFIEAVDISKFGVTLKEFILRLKQEKIKTIFATNLLQLKQIVGINKNRHPLCKSYPRKSVTGVTLIE